MITAAAIIEHTRPVILAALRDRRLAWTLVKLLLRRGLICTAQTYARPCPIPPTIHDSIQQTMAQQQAINLAIISGRLMRCVEPLRFQSNNSSLLATKSIIVMKRPTPHPTSQHRPRIGPMGTLVHTMAIVALQSIAQVHLLLPISHTAVVAVAAVKSILLIIPIACRWGNRVFTTDRCKDDKRTARMDPWRCSSPPPFHLPQRIWALR
jgi:hypothetical protein